jgi:probable F420-dependent oxidoreductase
MTPIPARHGITIPLPGIPLGGHQQWMAELAGLGFTDVWSAETAGSDAFVPLALAAAWEPTLRLGTAVVSVYTRGPGVLAQSVGAMCQAAPGRFALGIGTSSKVVAEGWNDKSFDKPYQRVRDTVRFLRAALAGEKVTEEYETFSISRFQLGTVPEAPPPILVAALRPGMLRLAGTEGDGAILNWLSAEDVKVVAPYVGAGKEIVARIFVVASEDRAQVYAIARRMITAYLTVPSYAMFHEWLGRGELLAPMSEAWNAGERKAALDAVPDELIDQLFVWGAPDQIRSHLARYVANGVTTPIPMLVLPNPTLDTIRSIAPNQP